MHGAKLFVGVVNKVLNKCLCRMKRKAHGTEGGKAYVKDMPRLRMLRNARAYKMRSLRQLVSVSLARRERKWKQLKSRNYEWIIIN